MANAIDRRCGARRSRVDGRPRLCIKAAVAMLNVYLQRNLAREWVDSLHVKLPEPLGEDAMARLKARWE